MLLLCVHIRACSRTKVSIMQLQMDVRAPLSTGTHGENGNFSMRRGCSGDPARPSVTPRDFDFAKFCSSPSSVLPRKHQQVKSEKERNSLFPRLVIRGDGSSFTFGVHAGSRLKTFAPQHLSKKAARKPLHLHSYPLPPSSPSLLLFTTSATNQAQFLLGGLETVLWVGSPLSSLAVPQACFSPLCFTGGGGSLKGNALLVYGLGE